MTFWKLGVLWQPPTLDINSCPFPGQPNFFLTKIHIKFTYEYWTFFYCFVIFHFYIHNFYFLTSFYFLPVPCHWSKSEKNVHFSKCFSQRTFFLILTIVLYLCYYPLYLYISSSFIYNEDFFLFFRLWFIFSIMITLCIYI